MAHSTPAKRMGVVFWLSVIWVAAIIGSAATAHLWAVPTFDTMDWDNVNAYPGACTSQAVLQRANMHETVEYIYWLGTDTMGRDIVSRIIHGARTSLLVGLLAPLIGFVVGGMLGCTAGYFKGRIETSIVAVMDIILAFPALVLLLVIAFYFKASLVSLILSLGLLTIPAFCRVARAKTLALSDLEFIQAARLTGAAHSTILIREIMPNVIVHLAIYGLLIVAFMIMAEGALSFLGLGMPSPIPSWGSMIAEGREVLDQAPHISMVPAGFMFLTVLSFNLIGDCLRTRLERRTSQL